MNLDQLTWPDVDRELGRLTPIVLPFGALEQHGPHLPLDTDTVCAQAVADRGAELAGAVALPALSYGAPSRPRSGGGPVFPLGAEIPLGVYYDVVRGIVGNLLARGARNLLLLTWHTENGVVLYDAAREAVSQASADDAKLVVLDSPGSLMSDATRAKVYVDGPVPGMFEHAGLIETSVMLALAPDRVREHSEVPAALPRLPYDVIPMPADSVSASGSFTSPAHASAAIGTLMLDEVFQRVADLITREFPVSARRGSAR